MRTRTERLHTFDSAGEVEACLHRLLGSGVVRLLERQTGQKEQRWQQLIAEEAEPVAGPAAVVVPSAVPGSMADRVAQLEDRVAKLESALADLL